MIFAVAMVLNFASVGAQEYHTSPYCWAGPRAYASAQVDPIKLQIVRVESAAAIEGTVSPNGAYKFVITERSDEIDPNWYPQLIIFNERPYLLEIQFPNTRSITEAKWINENLIYIRLWWGRIAASDIIVDAEKEAIIYQQRIRDGGIAFQQYKQCAEVEWKDDEQCQCLHEPATADAE